MSGRPADRCVGAAWSTQARVRLRERAGRLQIPRGPRARERARGRSPACPLIRSPEFALAFPSSSGTRRFVTYGFQDDEATQRSEWRNVLQQPGVEARQTDYRVIAHVDEIAQPCHELERVHPHFREDTPDEREILE